MPLTTEDTNAIRALIREELHAVVLKPPPVVETESDGVFCTARTRPVLSEALIDAITIQVYHRIGSVLSATAQRLRNT